MEFPGAQINHRQPDSRILDLLPAVLCVFRRDGVLELLTDGLSRLTGLDSRSLEGLGWTNCLRPEDLAEVRSRWQACVDVGAPFEAEFRLRRGSGDFRWFLARHAPERDGQGAVVRWIGLWTDIDSQKRV